MRKFKVKNKPKRKYVKKNTDVAHSSLTKTAWYGFVPLFLIAIGLFATTLITTPILSRIASETPRVVPAITLEPLKQRFASVYTTFQSSLRSLDLALPTQQIAKTAQHTTATTNNFFQNISIIGAKLLHGVGGLIMALLYSARTFGEQAFSFVALCIRSIVIFSLLFIQRLGQAISFTYLATVQFTYFLGKIAWDTLSFITSLLVRGIVSLSSLMLRITESIRYATQFAFNATIQFILQVGNFIVHVARTTGKFLYASIMTLFNLITRLGIAIKDGIMIALRAIGTFFSAVGRWVISVLTATGKGIADAYHATVRFISTPFIAVGNAYKKIEPGLQYIGGLITNAYDDLMSSFTDIMTFPTKLKK